MILDTLSFMQQSISLRLDYAEDLLAEEPLITTQLEPPRNQLLKVATQPVINLSADEKDRIDASWAEHSKRRYKNYLKRVAFKEEQKRYEERKGKRILEAYHRNVPAKRIAKRPNRYGFFTIE